MPSEETRLRDQEVQSHEEYIRQSTGGTTDDNTANDFNFTASRDMAGEKQNEFASDELGFEDNV